MKPCCCNNSCCCCCCGGTPKGMTNAVFPQQPAMKILSPHAVSHNTMWINHKLCANDCLQQTHCLNHGSVPIANKYPSPAQHPALRIASQHTSQMHSMQTFNLLTRAMHCMCCITFNMLVLSHPSAAPCWPTSLHTPRCAVRAKGCSCHALCGTGEQAGPT